MARFFNYLFGFITIAPVVVWLVALLITRFREVGSGDSEDALAQFVARGPADLWPLVLSAAMMWILVAGMTLIMRPRD